MSHRPTYLARYYGFVIALMVSALLWFFSAMSEERTFDGTLRIEWVGFDTARHVIAEADQQVPITITSNGFAAMRNNRALRIHPFRISVAADTVVQFSDCQRAIVSQVRLHGVRNITSRQATLSLSLSERASHPFVPAIHDVQFEFADGYGLYGRPVVKPDTVWLYGSEETLAKIGQLSIVKTTIDNITTSASYTVPLDPVWERYTDVRPSTTQVEIQVPTAVYSEQTLLLPISLRSEDSDVKLRIYPEQAKVTLWVADQNSNHLATDMIRLAVDYDNSNTDGDRLAIRAVSFPDFVRIKKIEPEEVRFVIIK